MLTRSSFEGTAAEWDALGSGFEEFTLNQSHAWGEGRRRDGWSVARDVWRDADGSVVAAATVLRRRVRGVRVAYVSRGPLVRREDLTAEEVERRFVACIVGYRRQLHPGELLVCAVRQTYAEVGPNALREAGLRPLATGSRGVAFTALVPLSEPDAVLRTAASDWRNRYKRSEGLLSQVRTSSDPEAFLQARRLVARRERDKGFTTNITPSLLHALSSGRARLFYLEDDARRMVAALLVAIAGRTASRFLAAVESEQARVHPGSSRVLEVAGSRWAFEQGASVYDLEGLDPMGGGGGVTDFKLGMRGRRIGSPGLHVASRHGQLGAALSLARRQPWRRAGHLWRSSKPYVLHVLVRRATRGWLRWEPVRLYRRLLHEPPPQGRQGFVSVALDRFDRADFEFRLSMAAELWDACQDLAPGRKECVLLLTKEGLAAAYAFVSWGRAELPELDVSIPLEADEAYVSNGYVVPELRGKRLYPLLLGEVCGRLRSRGVPSVLIASSPFHVPSVRAIEGAGFLPIRDGRLQRVGGWRRLRWNGVPGTA